MELNDLFDYRNGELYWKIRDVDEKGFNKRFSGRRADNRCSNDYLYVKHKDKVMMSHRVVWEMHNGPIPTGLEIDHINHVKDDNRIENLRLVDRSENMKKTKIMKHNTSGVVGVTFHKAKGKWQAQIQHLKKNIYIGLYSSFEDAARARKEKEIELGFHENHGKTLDEI